MGIDLVDPLTGELLLALVFPALGALALLAGLAAGVLDLSRRGVRAIRDRKEHRDHQA